MTASTRIRNLEKRAKNTTSSSDIEEKIKQCLFLQGLPKELRSKNNLKPEEIWANEWAEYKAGELAKAQDKTQTEARLKIVLSDMFKFRPRSWTKLLLPEEEDKIREVDGFVEITFVLDDNTGDTTPTS